MKVLEFRLDSSFTDGYFTASYEVAKAFPPPFDLSTPLGWDRDQIMAKAAALSDADPDQGGSLQETIVPGLSTNLPGSDGSLGVEAQDPPSALNDLGRSSAPHMGDMGSSVAASLLEGKQTGGEQVEGSQQEVHGGERD